MVKAPGLRWQEPWWWLAEGALLSYPNICIQFICLFQSVGEKMRPCEKKWSRPNVLARKTIKTKILPFGKFKLFGLHYLSKESCEEIFWGNKLTSSIVQGQHSHGRNHHFYVRISQDSSVGQSASCNLFQPCPDGNFIAWLRDILLPMWLLTGCWMASSYSDCLNG